MKTALIVFVVLFVLIGLPLIGAGLGIITLPWLKLTSQIQTNQDIITKTYTADNAIYNYHWFQERSAAITALDTTISESTGAVVSFEDSAGPRKDWSFEDKTEDNRLRTVVQGQEAQYNSLVNEYNARAGEADRAIFKDNLPLFFNLKPF